MISVPNRVRNEQNPPQGRMVIKLLRNRFMVFMVDSVGIDEGERGDSLNGAEVRSAPLEWVTRIQLISFCREHPDRSKKNLVQRKPHHGFLCLWLGED